MAAILSGERWVKSYPKVKLIRGFHAGQAIKPELDLLYWFKWFLAPLNVVMNSIYMKNTCDADKEYSVPQMRYFNALLMKVFILVTQQ